MVTEVGNIKQAMLQYGAIVTAISINDRFIGYRAGVFDEDVQNGVNHAGVLVGWDDERSAWIFRNSWGPQWGESGYMYIRYGLSQVGTGAAFVNLMPVTLPHLPATASRSPSASMSPSLRASVSPVRRAPNERCDGAVPFLCNTSVAGSTTKAWPDASASLLAACAAAPSRFRTHCPSHAR